LCFREALGTPAGFSELFFFLWYAGKNKKTGYAILGINKSRHKEHLMATILSKPEYEASTAASRDKRMAWWREARFGMFVHFGLYTVLGRHEWAMAIENWPVAEYEKLADGFQPKPGAPKEWAKLARAAGMKYMVMTTRHHEGFSLWDSKANP
jgi:alpha-L-fucosidase